MPAKQKANKQGFQAGDLVKSNFSMPDMPRMRHHVVFDEQRELGIVLEVGSEIKTSDIGSFYQCKVEWLSGTASGQIEILADSFLLKLQ